MPDSAPKEPPIDVSRAQRIRLVLALGIVNLFLSAIALALIAGGGVAR